MDNYRILEAIGEGSFGRVFRGLCKTSGIIVALKFIPKRNKVDRELKSLRRECEIQKELFHPNIVRMVDAFETEGEVVAVSEYVPIQLYSLLEKYGTLPEERVRDIACNLISAIYYLHSLRILHRDIKPQNILLTLEGEAKLCDFGFSRKMGINTYVLTSVKGTPLYMAPELIDENPYDHTADLWSLGCILFELLTGKPPFCTTNIVQLIKMVQTEPVNWPSHLSVNCRNFLEGLLQKEPSKRLTWPHLLDHMWIKNGVIVIQSSIDPSPLTCPLSSSQQKIKEQQKRQLIKQGLSQPKLLRNFSETGFDNSLRQTSNQDDKTKLLSNLTTNYPEDVDRNLFNDDSLSQNVHPINSEDNDMIELKTFTQATQAIETSECHQVPTNLDVRQAVGSSVRKLSTISQESGFKDDDVADITSHEVAQTSEKRKDSMVNYLSNSIDSSRRGSRPSYVTIDNFATPQLSNINEESIGNFSSTFGDKGISLIIPDCSEKPIEQEEWLSFLDKTLSEVVNDDNIDIFYQHSEITMIISPLQNCNCPLSIIDKIAILLMLPFVMEPEKIDRIKILKLYIECKVVPNLIYAFKSVSKLSSSVKSHEYNQNDLSTLQSLISLICFLIHSHDECVTQFCDAVCILSTYSPLGNLLMFVDHSEVTEKILAILNRIMNYSLENSSIVEEVLNCSNNLSHLLEKLINHKSAKICIATCFLIGYSAKASCPFIASLKKEHNIVSDLINLETSPNLEIQKSASFAVSLLLKCLHNNQE